MATGETQGKSPALLAEIASGSVTADGAYDGAPTYAAIAARAGAIPVIIPPHVTAVLSDDAAHYPTQHDQHIALLAD